MVTRRIEPKSKDEWVLLSYRVPRNPSTPRIAIWRRLKDLGIAQVGDGLVALPNRPALKEHLEWTAAKVLEANGEAIVWVATPAARRDGVSLTEQLRQARIAEYDALLKEVASSPTVVDHRTIARWRREWRRIDRRDYFPSAQRDATKLAIDATVQRDQTPGEDQPIQDSARVQPAEKIKKANQTTRQKTKQ